MIKITEWSDYSERFIQVALYLEEEEISRGILPIVNIYEKIRAGEYDSKLSSVANKKALRQEQVDLKYKFYLDVCEHNCLQVSSWSKYLFDYAYNIEHSTSLSELEGKP